MEEESKKNILDVAEPYTHYPTADAAAYKNPTHDYSSHYLNMKLGGDHKLWSPTKELWIVEGSWGLESQFSPWVQFPVSRPGSSGGLIPIDHTGYTNWTP